MGLCLNSHSSLDVSYLNMNLKIGVHAVDVFEDVLYYPRDNPVHGLITLCVCVSMCVCVCVCVRVCVCMCVCVYMHKQA